MKYHLETIRKTLDRIEIGLTINDINSTIDQIVVIKYDIQELLKEVLKLERGAGQ